MADDEYVPEPLAGSTVLDDAMLDGAGRGMKRKFEGEGEGDSQEPTRKRSKMESTELVNTVPTINPERDPYAQKFALKSPTTIRMLVPNAAAGSMIGKGGSTSKALRDRCRAMVKIIKSDQLNANDHNCIIRLEGTLADVHIGMQITLQTLTELGYSSSRDRAPNELSLQFLIPESAMGGIIGHGGANIKSIIDETGCNVRLIRLNNPSMYSMGQARVNEAIVHCTGTLAAICKAHLLVSSKVNEDGPAPVDLPPRDRSEAAETRTEVFTIPPELVGDVIGKGGATIQDINRVSGARVHISQEFAPGTTERAVKITGTQAQIASATEIITRLLSTAVQSKSATPTTEATSRRTVPIPTRSVGEILGRGGATIRNIARDSGAKIHIEEEMAGVPTRDVVITGTATQIALALERINSIIGGPVGPPSAGASAASYGAFNPGLSGSLPSNTAAGLGALGLPANTLAALSALNALTQMGGAGALNQFAAGLTGVGGGAAPMASQLQGIAALGQLLAAVQQAAPPAAPAPMPAPAPTAPSAHVSPAFLGALAGSGLPPAPSVPAGMYGYGAAPTATAPPPSGAFSFPSQYPPATMHLAPQLQPQVPSHVAPPQLPPHQAPYFGSYPPSNPYGTYGGR